MNIKPRISVRALYVADPKKLREPLSSRLKVIQFRVHPDLTWGQVRHIAEALTGGGLVVSVGVAPTPRPIMLPWRAYCPGHEPVEIMAPSFDAAQSAAQELFKSPDAKVISALAGLPKVTDAGREDGLSYVQIEKIGGAA